MLCIHAGAQLSTGLCLQKVVQGRFHGIKLASGSLVRRVRLYECAHSQQSTVAIVRTCSHALYHHRCNRTVTPLHLRKRAGSV